MFWIVVGYAAARTSVEGLSQGAAIRTTIESLIRNEAAFS
jgi:hypothetical protein